MMLIETQPSLREAIIVAEICEDIGIDYWISFSCRDERHINEGDHIRECARTLAEGFPHLRMIGVNCTRPEYIWNRKAPALLKEPGLPDRLYGML